MTAHVRALLFLLVFLLATPTAYGALSEQSARNDLRQMAGMMIAGGEFGSLEEACRRFVDGQERTPSGVWKLTFFQYGLDDAIASQVRSAGRGAELETIDRLIGPWERRNPQSSCASVTRARAYMRVAWMHRGGGYAHTVPSEAWPLFHEWNEKARRELERTKGASGRNPEWYATMIEVAKVQQWSDADLERLLDEGIARHRVYYQMYFNAMQALAPKWRGDVTALERFARRAISETEDTEGLSIYARVYWSVADDFRDRIFTDTSANWPLMRRGFQEMVARFPDDRNLNAFANFACIAQDEEILRALLDRIEGRIVREVWVASGGPEGCRVWAESAARSPPQGQPAH